MKSLGISLKITSYEVPLENADGTVENLQLVELTAAQRDAYLDSLSTRMRRDADGTVRGMQKFDGHQADLISRCLVRKENGSPIALLTIQQWPASQVQLLFDAAQEMNHLVNKEEKAEAVKNA